MLNPLNMFYREMYNSGTEQNVKRNLTWKSTKLHGTGIGENNFKIVYSHGHDNVSVINYYDTS